MPDLNLQQEMALCHSSVHTGLYKNKLQDDTGMEHLNQDQDYIQMIHSFNCSRIVL